MSTVWGGPDTRHIRRVLDAGDWKRNITSLEISDIHHDSHVQSLPEDYRDVMFNRVLDTGWDGAVEKVCRWRIKVVLAVGPGMIRKRGMIHDTVRK